MKELKANRPLSPHLQVYKPQISSVLSIMHRFSGIVLSAGVLVLTGWLYAAAYSPECYAWLSDMFGTVLGQLALAGWTLAFFYHFGNGIRHLFWDMGKGFSLPNVTRSGVGVLLFAFAATGYIWFTILSERGVL